jgi:hypothetical protein
VTPVTDFPSHCPHDRSMTTSATIAPSARSPPSRPPPYASLKSTHRFLLRGKIPVAEACSRKGLDPAGLLAEIDQAIGTPLRIRRTADRSPARPDRPHPGYTSCLHEDTAPRVEARLAKVLHAHSDAMATC